MGNIVGGIVGGIGSLLGGQSAKHNDLTGFNYLTGQNGVGSVVNNGASANNTASALLNGTATNPQTTAFNNYLNSTGYQFQQKQGAGAITGSAAARGILNSGATVKGLTQFGQGLAGQSFGNYLSDLSGLTGSGLQASGQIGQAGTQGGQAAGSAMSSGITNAFGKAAGLAPLLF